MERRGLERRVVREAIRVEGRLALTDERDHFPKAVQITHPSQRSESRERQSQEKCDSVQLEGVHQTRVGVSRRVEIHTRYSNLLNHPMNGNTVPNTPETTHSDKKKSFALS